MISRYKKNKIKLFSRQVFNTDELEKIFARAKSAVVNGAKVILSRKESSGQMNKFDEMDTLEALEIYKAQVFKYLK